MSKDSWNGYLQDDFHKAWWTRSKAMLSHEVQLPTGSFYEPLHVWCMKCLRCSCTISSLLPEFFFGVLPYRTFEHQMDFGAKTDVLVSPDDLKFCYSICCLCYPWAFIWHDGTKEPEGFPCFQSCLSLISELTPWALVQYKQPLSRGKLLMHL